MKKKNKRYLTILLVCLLFLLLEVCPAIAVDELFLTGTVRRIDAASGVVVVAVKSGGCRGEHNFYSKQITADSVGKDISFMINSSTCRGSETYKIVRLITIPQKIQSK